MLGEKIFQHFYSCYWEKVFPCVPFHQIAVACQSLVIHKFTDLWCAITHLHTNCFIIVSPSHLSFVNIDEEKHIAPVLFQNSVTYSNVLCVHWYKN